MNEIAEFPTTGASTNSLSQGGWVGTSRRCFLKHCALLSGASLAAGLQSGSALAQQKASKVAMKYQDKPNGDKQCSGCSQFIPPNTCNVVEGVVSPQGYCLAWSKK